MSGAITVKPAFNDPAKEAAAFGNLNSSSVADLLKIQAYVQNNTIGDFQVLVTPSGRVLINDPMGLTSGKGASDAVQELIKDMLNTAKNSKK